MGGVRILVGQYDGTQSAAVMVNDSNGWAFGPLFTGDDPYEQIEEFIRWVRDMRWLPVVNEVFAPARYPDHLVAVSDGADVRDWNPWAILRLVMYWRSFYLDDDAEALLDPHECGGCGHAHMFHDEYGPGEPGTPDACASCGCTLWTPGNRVAERHANERSTHTHV